MIKLNNIKFAWKEKLILDIKNLEIKDDEKVFIEGPSGSGKSTLLNLIAAVVSPKTGTVNIDGVELTLLKNSHKDEFRAQNIGFIFQQFNLIPYLNLIENITLPCKFSQNRKNKALKRSGSLEKEAIRLLNNLGINSKEILSRSVNELSVGQQQRVAAARAMIGSPKLIIADEPTSALDNNHRTSFIKTLFKECEKENITLIFVSHDESLKTHFQRTIKLSNINDAVLEEKV